jgi:hypothetical protein
MKTGQQEPTEFPTRQSRGGDSDSTTTLLKHPKLGLLLALLMAGSMWFYVQGVLIPYQKADAAQHARPRGNLSDLYPRWHGTRELLLRHRDPYGAEVTREIQTGYYGRPLDSNRPGDPKDEVRFAYPIYVAFLLAPFVAFPFSVVQTAFTWILALATVASVGLWVRVLRWRPCRAVLAILLLLTLGSFATAQGIKLQQLTLLVGALLAASAASLVSGRLFLAGALLALATIKPQLAALPAVWVMLWTAGDWRRRQRVFWGFGLTLALLIGGGVYLLPGWLSEFYGGLAAYEQYTGRRPLLEVLAGHTGGRLLTGFFLLSTGVLGWRLRRVEADSQAFQLILAWVLAVALVVAPMVAPYDQVLLLPGIFLVARSWKSILRRNRVVRAASAAATLILGWPWLASFALALASLVLAPASVQRGWAIPLWTSFLIPLAVLGELALCVKDSAGIRGSAS